MTYRFCETKLRPVDTTKRALSLVDYVNMVIARVLEQPAMARYHGAFRSLVARDSLIDDQAHHAFAQQRMVRLECRCGCEAVPIINLNMDLLTDATIITEILATRHAETMLDLIEAAEEGDCEYDDALYEPFPVMS